MFGKNILMSQIRLCVVVRSKIEGDIMRDKGGGWAF